MDTCYRIAIPVAALLFVSFLLIPVVSAEDTGLTRGSRFTITVTGTPNTPYYVWLTRTFTMSGEPGDQPPVIVESQENIEKDPPGGPYVIGSYRINNGGGRTILDDVAPSTPSMSCTEYYAQVTTDKNGRAIVAFQTSANTAMRTFSVKVENAQSVAKDNILVQRWDSGVKRETLVIDTVATPTVLTTVPTPAPPSPPVTVPPLPATPLPLPSPSPTLVYRAPVGIGICIMAAGAVMLVRQKRA